MPLEAKLGQGDAESKTTQLVDNPPSCGAGSAQLVSQPNQKSTQTDSPSKICPLCHQYIPTEARACFHCGHLIDGWYRYVQKYGLLISPFFAVLLFWLGGQNERRNLRLDQDRHNNQVILYLKNELSQNYANINNIREILTKDLRELKEGRVTIVPLVNFQFTAWEHARFGRADFLYKADTKDFMKLKNSYFMLHILESKIHNREQYRLMHEGLLNFPGRMEILDKDILSILDGVQESIRQGQDYLEQIHTWKVTGDSFAVDKGLVVEVERDGIKK